MFSFDDKKAAGADALVEAYRRLVPNADVDLGRQYRDFSWRGALVETGVRTLFRLRCNLGWQARSRYEKSSFCISLPAHGAMQATIRGKQYVASTAQAMITCVPEIPRLDVLGDHGHARAVLKWDLTEATRVLSSVVEGASLDTLDLYPVLNMATADGRMLRGLLDAMAIGMTDAKRHSPLTLELMSEAALRLILERFPHRYSSRLNGPKHTIVPRHIKRAIDYMHVHKGEALRIQDIADVCGVSMRALEDGFMNFTGTTPSAYLKRLRLDGVRRSLQEGGTTVSDAALQWGFVSLGRFSRQYLAAFGELPSQTLRKA